MIRIFCHCMIMATWIYALAIFLCAIVKMCNLAISLMAHKTILLILLQKITGFTYLFLMWSFFVPNVDVLFISLWCTQLCNHNFNILCGWYGMLREWSLKITSNNIDVMLFVVVHYILKNAIVFFCAWGYDICCCFTQKVYQ